MLHPISKEPFQPTAKNDGDLIISSTYVHRHGSTEWTPRDWPNERLRDEPSCEAVQRTGLGWFVLCGAVAAVAAFWWLVR